jgi:hypothetical protein
VGELILGRGAGLKMGGCYGGNIKRWGLNLGKWKIDTKQ